MNDNIEYYKELILGTLYKDFMSNPPYRINNVDVDRAFGNINNKTNFRIAREQLIQDGLLYGKNVDFGNPRFFEITGEGIVYYEKNYIIPSDDRKYILLVSKLLTFLRDLGDVKKDIRKYIVDSDDPRINKVEIPLSDINDILKTDYNYKMSDLKWIILKFTSRFVSNHIMGINGIGIGNKKLAFHNPDVFCLNASGYNFLKDVFLIEKFQKIGNNDGRDRVIQLYDDLSTWTSKKRWVDIAINMGSIIEYLIDNYVQNKSIEKSFESSWKNKKWERLKYQKKLSYILQNPINSPDPIFDLQYRATWKRIQNVLIDWRNYVHISKLVKERSPLDEKSIKKFYSDFESTINILLDL